MFRKTQKDQQIDLFSGVPTMLQGVTRTQYSNDNSWHNQFRKQILSRINENNFQVLFNASAGAPNSSICQLVSMMILKEAFGWSDSQLFEQCRFNLLVRSALGLMNLDDEVPVESTYYLFRKRIYEYHKQTGQDLMEQTFTEITHQQVKEFDVNGRSIRMDSKLISSNIAFYSRYEIILHTLCAFYKSLNNQEKSKLSVKVNQQLKELSKEEPQKTVYHSTREEIKTRLQSIGVLMHLIIKTYPNYQRCHYKLLTRVFEEQFKLTEDKQIELRAKEEISSSSVQSPHDDEGAYRNKNGQEVKGYSVNITETISDDDSLDLVTSVIVKPANVPDTKFVEPAIEDTTMVTDQAVEKVYADGAYQSPENDPYCQNIDMVYTGIQGFESRYDLEMIPTGLMVTDTQTGQTMQAVLAKKVKNSKEDRWRIKTEKGYLYFSQLAIRASKLRKDMKNKPLHELRKRNNVESTIFHLGCKLRSGKTRYRGLYKQSTWAYCRCLWINLIRITENIKQTCQRTFKTIENITYDTVLGLFLSNYQTSELNIR